MRNLFSTSEYSVRGTAIFLAFVFAAATATSVNAQLVFTTPSVDFGKIEVGSSSPAISVDLRNTGNQPLEVNCAGGAVVPVQFSTSHDCADVMLNPGESCPFTFSFSPVTNGALSGSSNPTCNSVPVSVELSGEGVLPKLVFDTPSVDFGPVIVGSASPSIEVNLFNNGTAPVTLACNGGSTSGPQFIRANPCLGVTLNPGESCPLSFSFEPDAVGSFMGDSQIDCNGVSLSAQLQGEGLLQALVMDTTAIDFGKVEVGTISPTVSTNLRNQGPDPITLSCAGGGPSPAVFGGGQHCQGQTLNSGDTCDWGYTFTPSATGEVIGDSNFSCNGVGLGVELRGQGVADLSSPNLSFDTPEVDFGIIEVGSTSPTISVDMRNTGDQPVTVNCSGGAASPLQFAGAQNCQGEVLNPGDTCPFTFRFSPTAPGVVNGGNALTCNTNSLGVDLTGEGVLPQLVFDTPSVDFGAITVGSTSPTTTINLINQGMSAVTVGCTGGAPSHPQFSSSQFCQEQTLQPGDSCPFYYRFTPDADSSFTGNGDLSCNGVSFSVQLQGDGILPALVIDTPEVDFGALEVNTSSPAVSVNLRNQGPGPVTINCMGGSPSPPQFGAAQACQGEVLNSGDTCAWDFTFTPATIGETIGANDFACNGVDLGVALKGEGLPVWFFFDSFEGD